MTTEEFPVQHETIDSLQKDLDAILSTAYDETLIVDHQGILLRHSHHYISDFWKTNLTKLVGKNLLDFEKEGTFSPSVARLVIEKKKKVSIVQDTKIGKKILAVGHPVFNHHDTLQRIVIVSKDITETSELKSELRETKRISEKYAKELKRIMRQPYSKEIIYCSQEMEQIMVQAEKLASFSSTVLIKGESGVGKELVAKAIHQKGDRVGRPFVTINCGAIPENLLESELFGYTKGAFTGANATGKKGFFQQADGGILLLDEIGEVPFHLQVKLLRVLQENEITPIGSVKPVPVDVQIIAATNQDLEELVREGNFRKDLFYRINVIPIRVPPLRERPEDIPLLVHNFMQQLNDRYEKDVYFTPNALNLLEVYHWPGNIRELQNLVERVFVTTDDNAITVKLVDQLLGFGKTKRTTPIITEITSLNEAQDQVEQQLIILAMQYYKTTTKAAEALGISQSAVSRKYNKILGKETKQT